MHNMSWITRIKKYTQKSGFRAACLSLFFIFLPSLFADLFLSYFFCLCSYNSMYLLECRFILPVCLYKSDCNPGSTMCLAVLFSVWVRLPDSIYVSLSACQHKESKSLHKPIYVFTCLPFSLCLSSLSICLTADQAVSRIPSRSVYVSFSAVLPLFSLSFNLPV